MYSETEIVMFDIMFDKLYPKVGITEKVIMTTFLANALFKAFARNLAFMKYSIRRSKLSWCCQLWKPNFIKESILLSVLCIVLLMCLIVWKCNSKFDSNPFCIWRRYDWIFNCCQLLESVPNKVHAKVTQIERYNNCNLKYKLEVNSLEYL